MAKVGRVRFLLVLSCAVLVVHFTQAHEYLSHEDDFAFDTIEHVDSSSSSSEAKLRRLWGVPDAPAYAGKLFTFRIPDEAFSGKISGFKVHSVSGGPPPQWLMVDGKHGFLRGVPGSQDVGSHAVRVTAIGESAQERAADIFTIDVRESTQSSFGSTNNEEQCISGDYELILQILCDSPFNRIKPKHRIRILTDLAKFMALNVNAFTLQPYKQTDVAKKQYSVMLSGPGDRMHKNREGSTAITLKVGCGGQMWHRHKLIVHQLREQSRDGAISELLHVPVTGWRVLKKVVTRQRRETLEGSAYDEGAVPDDEDYSGYDDDDYDAEEDPITEVDPAIATSSTAERLPETSAVPTPTAPTHPHRHHHGQPFAVDRKPPQTSQIPTQPTPTTAPVTDPSQTPAEPSTAVPTPTVSVSVPVSTSPRAREATTVEIATPIVATAAATASTDLDQISGRTVQIVPQGANETAVKKVEDNEVETRRITFDSHSPVHIVPDLRERPINTTTATPEPSPPITNPSTLSSASMTPVASAGTPLTTEEDSFAETSPARPQSVPTVVPRATSTEATTSEESDSMSEGTSTIFGRTTETIDFTFPVNLPPRIKHRMKKVAVTAGKAFSYIIPEDVFFDSEDGTNLKLEMFDVDGAPIKHTSWVQFNSTSREVYGLPLEEHVSRWEYLVQATDSEGLKVRDQLEITVQQHKGRRTVNHEFILKLRLEDKFPVAVDWQILILRGLVNLFRDTDMDQITVRNVDLNADPLEFVWTNDTLPKNICPQSDIDRLLGVLQSNEDGTPSAALVSAMSSLIRVKYVGWLGIGPCQPPPSPPPSVRPPPLHPDNFPPMPRNEIDHIDASVGRLLVFPVPEDSFYDPEDGSARNLKMWLVRGDWSALPSDHWLQFDSKNQEFYGLPTERDVGRKDYLLNCEDSGGLTANDGLVVVVHPASPIKPTVEFSMNLHQSAEPLVNNPSAKRKFVEKLALLLGNKNTSSIHIKDITERPTIITWYNTSLSRESCPNGEIEQLRKILVNDDDSLTERVDAAMGQEFPVMAVSLQPRGLCLGEATVVHGTEAPHPPGTAEDASKTMSSDDYLITFIVPAAVIAFMILVAGVVACALYRRRRSGKMSVGDDEERQAFRSRGIPVIFQDELDEKPDPSNKSPVIMKEEKPPLLPPPDYGGEGGSPAGPRQPYRPPPPFAASREPRGARPKATPSYRKPPPYVPP